MMDGKQIRSKLIGTDDERAVSPVIGVILMVAITVILAAVIAAFVMDMGQSQEAPAQAGVNIENTSDSANGYVEVTVTEMGDDVETVACAGDWSNSTSSVGGSFECAEGGNVIASKGDGSNTTIHSDIGN